MGVGLPSWEVVLASWEGCVGLCLGGTYYLACLPWGGLWPCPAWADLGDWGELFLSLCIRREVAWEELTSSEGRYTAPRRELLPSLGGRWAIAGLGRPPDAWVLGELLPSKEGWTVVGGELLPSLGGRWAMARVGWLPIAWLARVGWLPITWLLAWGRPVPSGRRWPVARGGLLPSPGGRRAMAGEGLWGFAWEVVWLIWLLRLLWLIRLPDCEFKLFVFELVLLDLVNFLSVY